MRVLLFDYDGVIGDSFSFWLSVFQRISKEHKVDFNTKEKYLALFRGNLFENMKKQGIEEHVLYEIKQEIARAATHKKTMPTFPGIAAVLDALAQDNMMKIVTSNHSNVVEAWLEKTWFDEILGYEKEHSKEKKILNVRKQFPNYEIFFIGDTPGDIIEGNHAGVQTVAALWGWFGDELLKYNPTFVAQTPTELLPLFTSEK